jgi:hypothetical protein
MIGYNLFFPGGRDNAKISDQQIIFNELQVDIFIRTIILKLQGKQF